MTAGSLSTQLGMFTKVAGNLSDADVSMTVSMDPTDERTATSSVIEATGRRRLRPGVRRGKRDATGMGIRCGTYRTRPSDDGGKRPEQCGHSQFPRRR